MTKYHLTLFTFALAAALSLTACKDTEIRQENEQLKTHIADLQKQLGEMGNRVDEATTAEDDAMKQNAALREQNDRLKARRGEKKNSPKSRRRHRRTTLNINPSERFREARS